MGLWGNCGQGRGTTHPTQCGHQNDSLCRRAAKEKCQSGAGHCDEFGSGRLNQLHRWGRGLASGIHNAWMGRHECAVWEVLGGKCEKVEAWGRFQHGEHTKVPEKLRWHVL